jgi:periplasmic protein TonB
MKKTLLLICLATLAIVAHAQQSTPKKNDPNADITIDAPVSSAPESTDKSSVDPSKIFTAVETEPSFPGGIEMFYKFLQYNIRYPAKAFEDKIQGKVFVSFTVEKDGSLNNIKVVRALGAGCDEEAVRVMELSPKWKPGVQNGRPVRVQYTMPISFSLAGR